MTGISYNRLAPGLYTAILVHAPIDDLTGTVKGRYRRQAELY